MKAPVWAILTCAALLMPSLADARPATKSPSRPPAGPSYSAQPQTVTPVCLDRSNIPQSELHWLYIPASPAELATHEDYAYLSGQLIRAGVVDASSCPLGGLWPDGYATACGLERTRAVSLYLQNVYDDEILAAGRDIGVPPVMLKQLIRYESQFWPVPMPPDHHGLGHLTHVGAISALFWNRDLYESTLAAAPGSNDLPRSLLSLMDASCPTCTYGVDIPKAERSIRLLAQVLLGYCKQTSRIIFNATELAPEAVVSYPTVWRLTLLNYNSGAVCAFDAVKANFVYGQKLSWLGIARKLDDSRCIRGVGYVDTITAPYYEFIVPR